MISDNNNHAYGVALLGNYENSMPTKELFRGLKNLLKIAVAMGKLREDYVLYPHNCFSETKSPGQYIINEIQTWGHYHNSSKLDEFSCINEFWN